MIVVKNFQIQIKSSALVMSEQKLLVKLIVLDSCPQSAMALEKWKKIELKSRPQSNTQIVKTVETFTLSEENEDFWKQIFTNEIKQVPCIVKCYGNLIEVYPHQIKPLEPINENQLNDWVQSHFMVNPFK